MSSLEYRADVEPFEATAHDGTQFTATHCWWDLQKSSITLGWYVTRTDLADATDKNRTAYADTPITEDGKITWPDGPQPPAWFTAAAEAMMVGLAQDAVDAAVAETLALADTWDDDDDDEPSAFREWQQDVTA